jgi:uncharacterized protein (DUF1015 family)
VPRFEPFRALRYRDSSPAHLEVVTAPPYDVLSETDRAELAAKHPTNIVHVDVPLESDGPARYDKAAGLLSSWIATGDLVLDDQPSFTIYRMEFTDALGRLRRTSGVIGALEVVDEGSGGVLPHERTTPKAKTDRLDLTRATLANLSPVWGLSLTAGLTDLLAEPAEPVGSITVEGVVHSFERVSDPSRVEAISRAVGGSDVVIADGHHRYAISRTFRDEQRADDRGTHGNAELTMTYVGELIEEQLSVDAIHRLYTGISASELTRAFESFFDIHEAGALGPAVVNEMRSRGALVLVRTDRTGLFMVPRPSSFDGVRDLDGARLEHVLRGVAHEVTYQHGVEHILDIVASGRAEAGVLIRPVTVAEIRRTADEGLLMPPKSTFFTPKLRTGPVIRPLGTPSSSTPG